MNKGFVLSNFINIDNEIERLFSNSPLRKLICGALLLIYNDDNTEISYSKKLFEMENIHLSEDTFHTKVTHSKLFKITDNIFASFDKTDTYFQTTLSLFHSNSENDNPTVDLIILSDNMIEMDVLINERSMWQSLEYFFYYIQILLMGYEKLYLMIDVYTDLLIAKVHYLPHHMTNVANWCVLLSNELKLSSIDQITLYFAALIHDIGILFVPDEVISKPSKLTPEEYEVVKQHANRSAQIAEASLYGLPFFKNIPNIVRHHHENYDGSGYPDGLSEANIPFLSRILNIADSVDAMLSHRTFRTAMRPDEVMLELTTKSGKLFDPNIVKMMIKVMEEHKFMPSEALADADFIPHASISFYYQNIKTIKTFTGNLIVSKQKGKFLRHDASENISDLNIKDVHKCTLSFFKQNEFIEFNTDVYGILENKFFLTNFVYLPSDKYFSLVWEGETLLTLDATTYVNVKLLKLGGNSVVFESSLEEAKSIIDAPLGSIKIAICEKIGDLEIDTLINIRIVKYYDIGKGVLFNCNFIDLHPTLCDLLLKLLFRKQIEIRMNKSTTNH